jgi:hypothetical protein
VLTFTDNYKESLEDIVETLTLGPFHFDAFTGNGMRNIKLKGWVQAVDGGQLLYCFHLWLD